MVRNVRRVRERPTPRGSHVCMVAVDLCGGWGLDGVCERAAHGHGQLVQSRPRSSTSTPAHTRPRPRPPLPRPAPPTPSLMPPWAQKTLLFDVELVDVKG